MGRKVVDLTGCEFGFLRVISRAPDIVEKSGRKSTVWRCKCLLCGNEKNLRATSLKKTKSCGCLAQHNGAIRRNKKICVICGKEFNCAPSNNSVTCSPECRAENARRKHIGLRHTEETRKKISKVRGSIDRCKEIQAAATEAAKNSPNSGCFETNMHAIDWHLISPDGKHYYFHSLKYWLRKNCKELFGFDSDSKEFVNAVSGISRVKRSVMGKLPEGQRPGYSYKGWRVVPTDDDYNKYANNIYK